MSMPTVKLIPCKECNGIGHPVLAQNTNWSGDFENYVYCNRCGKKTDKFPKIHMAINTWNSMNRKD